MRKLIFIIFIALVSCKQTNKQEIFGTYSRKEKDSTTITYAFETDSTLIFTTNTDNEGIFITKCSFKKDGDSIYMATYPEPVSVHYLSYADTFYIINDSCIIQKNSGNKFCK